MGVSSGYFNRFDPATGQLHYAITLTNFTQSGHPTGMQLDESHAWAVIGTIVIEGNNIGSSEFISANLPETPAKIITLDQLGDLSPN